MSLEAELGSQQVVDKVLKVCSPIDRSKGTDLKHLGTMLYNASCGWYS